MLNQKILGQQLLTYYFTCWNYFFIIFKNTSVFGRWRWISL